MAEDLEPSEIQQRLARVEAQLEQLFEHLDIRPEESGQLDPLSDPEIQDLLAKGNDMQAAKRYHELTGLGLKESKDAIDAARPHG